MDPKSFNSLLRLAKQQGFSDFQIARALYKDKANESSSLAIRNYRKDNGITPVVKQIDTLAAGIQHILTICYLTYNGEENDVEYTGDHNSVIVLGSGA